MSRRSMQDYELSKGAIAAIEKLIELDLEFPGIVLPEMLAHIDVLAHSARIGKYPLNNWLEAGGRGCDHKSQYASIDRHKSEAYCLKKVDKDSGLDPRLHAMCRLGMDYTRDMRGLTHPDDPQELEDIAEFRSNLEL